MRKILFGLLATILVAVVAFSCAPQPAPAPTPTPTLTPTPEATYYQGKRIEIVVGGSPGGGSDMCARVAANFLPKYIPGNPEIVVSNQPGASGQIANKVFYNETRPDGLTLLQGSTSAVRLQMKKGPEAIDYDLTKYKFVGNIVREQSVLLIKKGQKARLTDPSAKTIQVGTKAGEEVWLAMILWGKEFLGWNVKVVPGYHGSSEIEMAFRRPGEVEMYASSNAFIIKRLIEDGVAEVVCSIGKRPDFPDAPTFEEILQVYHFLVRLEVVFHAGNRTPGFALAKIRHQLTQLTVVLDQLIDLLFEFCPALLQIFQIQFKFSPLA